MMVLAKKPDSARLLAVFVQGFYLTDTLANREPSTKITITQTLALWFTRFVDFINV